MTAEERLEKYKKAKERAEQEKNEHSSFPKEDLPEFKCCVLNKEQPKIIRLIGNSPLMRENPTDPLIVKRSMCINDDGKWVTVILSNDRDHPINKLFRTIIGKYKYDKETKIKTYDNVNKPSFQRFMTNGKSKEQISAYERGMQPDTFYLFNCIDKTDNWCKENKHTKLLCWDSNKKEVDGKTRENCTYGVKPSLYNNIFDVQCTKLNRMFDQFDVVVKRLKEKLGDSYLTVCIPEEKTSISNMGLNPDDVSMEYLTDEEEAYEKYKLEDIPFCSRPTSCTYFNKVFGKLIKQADIDFGTNLQADFAEWIEKEKAEFAKKNAEAKAKESSNKIEEESDDEIEETTVVETVEETTSEDLPSEVEENPTPTAQKVAKVAKVVKSTFDPLSLKDKFPYIDKLDADELELIVGYDESTNSLIFKEGVELCECPPPCSATIPMSFRHCYKCGAEFEE